MKGENRQYNPEEEFEKALAPLFEEAKKMWGLDLR
jgi:hypothetical protein